MLGADLVAKDLMDISVDQKQCIKILVRTESEEIGQVFQRLTYTDDVDLFSMWSCLLLCREVAPSSSVKIAVAAVVSLAIAVTALVIVK